jgi:hypothetical protein
VITGFPVTLSSVSKLILVLDSRFRTCIFLIRSCVMKYRVVGERLVAFDQGDNVFLAVQPCVSFLELCAGKDRLRGRVLKHFSPSHFLLVSNAGARLPRRRGNGKSRRPTNACDFSWRRGTVSGATPGGVDCVKTKI